MDDSPPFLKDYDPAGRIAFAIENSRAFIGTFESVIAITRRKLDNLLISMMYIRGKHQRRGFDQIRGLCSRLFVDSGVFSLRSKLMNDAGIHHRAAFWSLDNESKQKILDVGLENKSLFDAFTEEYCEFLREYQDRIDVVIDLDVDQFLGLDTAEDYYQKLLQVCPREKIMRVWHSYSRDWEDWKEWCESGQYTWLSVEGPDQHKRSVEMYNKFIDYAHQYGISVHILSVTTQQFMQQVRLDTCDSSSYRSGGRWAQLILPSGSHVSVGKRSKRLDPSSFYSFSEREKEEFEQLAKYMGFSVDILLEDWYARYLFNVLVYLVFFDKKVKSQAFSTNIF